MVDADQVHLQGYTGSDPYNTNSFHHQNLHNIMCVTCIVSNGLNPGTSVVHKHVVGPGCEKF